MPKLRGMAASRKGSPAIGLQTLIDRITGQKRKLAAPVTLEQAEHAAGVLERGRGRGARYRDAIAAGSTLRPFMRAAGNAVEAGLTAPRGQRLRAVVRGVNDVKGLQAAFKGPRLAREVVEGGVGGAVINAGREGLELGRARRQANAFLGSKTAAPLDLAKSKGLGRVAQLATGSRARALGQAAHNSNTRARGLFESARKSYRKRVSDSAETRQVATGRGARTPIETGNKQNERTHRLIDELQAEHRAHKNFKRVGAGAALAGVGAGAAAASRPAQEKLAAGLSRSLPALAKRIQPVRTSKLAPIVDDEVEFEV